MASLFGGMSEKVLACALVSGLPEGVRQLLGMGSRFEELRLDQVIAYAKAVAKDEPSLGAAGMESCTEFSLAASPLWWWVCGGPNERAR